MDIGKSSHSCDSADFSFWRIFVDFVILMSPQSFRSFERESKQGLIEINWACRHWAGDLPADAKLGEVH